MNETLIFFSKDFFGDAVNATFRVLRDDEVVYEEEFIEGRVELKVPEHLIPGVYDLVAQRGSRSYKIHSYVIPLSTHYFRHATSHKDLKINGKNLDPDTIIENYKVNPLFYSHVDKISSDLKQHLDDVARYSGNSEVLCWGGGVSFESSMVKVDAGEAIVSGKLYSWDDTFISMPPEGKYEVGILGGSVTLDDTVDLLIATLTVDANDFARIDVSSPYHTLIRGSNAYFFVDYEKSTDNITIPLLTSEVVSGAVLEDRIYGSSASSVAVSRVSLSFDGTGPVFFSDRLYLYADTHYFLLFDNNTLLCALPRWVGSHVEVDWSDGLSFVSWGEGGRNMYSIDYPYSPSHVYLCDGSPVKRNRKLLKKFSNDYGLLANIEQPDLWEEVTTQGATLAWVNLPSYPSASLYPNSYLYPV